jgi:drug/metabolite transporter (DMT)-like permease
MLTVPDIFLLTGVALVGAAAQLCLKLGALPHRPVGPGMFLQPCVFLGILLLLTNVLALVWVMRRLPLTLVMPLTALTHVFVPAGAAVFFRESLKRRFWTGALLLVAGVGIIAC